MLFIEKKGKEGMKSRTQFLMKKLRILPIFEAFVKDKIFAGACGIMRLINIHFAAPRVYPRSCQVCSSYCKGATFRYRK